MSIWLWVALFAYIAGTIVQWFGFKQKFQDLEEYNNFPIVWTAQVVVLFGCFFISLFWPLELLDNVK